MPRIRNIFKNEYLHSVLYRMLTLLVSMAQSIILARYLGAELKGESSYVGSVVAIIAIIMSFGMHQSYPYYKRKREDDGFLDVFISLMIKYHSIVLFLVVLIGIVFSLNNNLLAILVLSPFYSYSKITGYIYLIENPISSNRYNFAALISKLLLTIVAALIFERSFIIAVVLISVDQIVRCFIFTKAISFNFVISSKELKIGIELLKFGFFPMLALLMSTLNYKIDVILMGHMSAYVSMAGIGVYSIGQSLAEKVEIIPDTLQGVLASKLAKGSNYDEVAKVCRLCFATCLVIFFTILLIGHYLILLLYGNEYQGAYVITIITSLGLLPLGFFRLIGQYNIVNHKQHINVYLLAIAIVINVIFDLILIPVNGIVGAAIATTIGNTVCGVVFVLYFAKVTGISIYRMFVVSRNDLSTLKSIVNK